MYKIDFWDGDYYNPHRGMSKYLFHSRELAESYLKRLGYKYCDDGTGEYEWRSEDMDTEAYINMLKSYDFLCDIEEHFK